MDVVVPPIHRICAHEHTVSVRKNSRIAQGSSGISVVPQPLDSAGNIALWSAIVYLIEQQIPGCEHRPEIWFFGQGKRRLMMSWGALGGWMKSKTIDKHSVSLLARVTAGGLLPKDGWETLHTGNDYTLRIKDLKLQLCVDRRELEAWYRDGLVLPI